MSAFVLNDGAVYHTYSAYARGLDGLWGMYQWLDRAPLGRNEDEPGLWWSRHDEYQESPPYWMAVQLGAANVAEPLPQRPAPRGNLREIYVVLADVRTMASELLLELSDRVCDVRRLQRKRPSFGCPPQCLDR